jgi:hypothetical protein
VNGLTGSQAAAATAISPVLQSYLVNGCVAGVGCGTPSPPPAPTPTPTPVAATAPTAVVTTPTPPAPTPSPPAPGPTPEEIQAAGGPDGRAGESLSGLARSFFYAGARSLIITHWSVNDRMSAYLVALTFADYQAHPDHGLETSLAAAQRRVLDEAKSGDPVTVTAHPFYWAPMALIGEGGSAAQRVSGL